MVYDVFMEKGTHMSEESKQKLRLASIANGSKPPSRKGAKMSEDAKRRISETAKARGVGKWMLGRKNSPESNRKKSENSARYWLGKKRPGFSAQWRKNMGIAHLGHKVNPKSTAAIVACSKGKFGSEHPRWKEVKKRPLHKAVRQLFKYVNWRNTIFTRDSFTCVECGVTGCYIEADHYPVRFVDILKKNNIETIDQALQCEDLWDVGNGRTLCKPCHLKTLTWGRKPGLQNTVKQ